MWCRMSSFFDDSTQEEYLRLQQPLGHRCGRCWGKQRQRWKPYIFPSALSSTSFSFAAVHTLGTNSRETYGCEGSHGTESREMWIQLEILEAPPRKLFVPTASSISNGKTSQRSAEVLPPLSAVEYWGPSKIQGLCESGPQSQTKAISLLQRNYVPSRPCHSTRPYSTGYGLPQKKQRKKNKN